MKISLIMATVGRTEELKRFLDHLESQTYREFELIIVDGNYDDRVWGIADLYKDKYPIVHLREPGLGVSQARNHGLEYAAGEVIGFPDDDCWYPSSLLEEVAVIFNNHPHWHGIIGYITTEDGKASVTRLGSAARMVNRYNAWRCSTTSGMFYRRQVLPEPPVFDESIGPGAGTPWGCAEDAQLLIDVLAMGARVEYLPNLVIHHPDPFTYSSSVLHRRGYSYGCGTGYVMGINHYPVWFFSYYLLRSLAGMVLAAVRGDWKKCDHNVQAVLGRYYGWKMARRNILKS